MQTFRKKPVTIQAIQWDGSIKSGEQIAALLPAVSLHAEKDDPRPPRLSIVTLEGVMIARVGDWIIQGVAGEVYPCKPDIFAATYEPVTCGGVRLAPCTKEHASETPGTLARPRQSPFRRTRGF
jgi:hypothetical protein